MNNVKPPSAEAPDKALFSLMMAAFFICFSIPAFYWAYYNYGLYTGTTAFVQQLREKPETYLTPKEREDLKSQISSNSSMADRYKLEMLLSGAGGLVLLGIVALLFVKAFRSSKKRNYYYPIDPHGFKLPTGRIDVKYKKLHNILFALILIIFGGMLFLIFYQNLTSNATYNGNPLTRSLMMATPILLFLVPFTYIMLRARRKVVRSLDQSGITRSDGRHFTWSEFQGVVTQVAFNPRLQRKYIWRVELAFADGEQAWLIHQRIKNYDEVFAYVATLPQAVLKEVK